MEIDHEIFFTDYCQKSVIHRFKKACHLLEVKACAQSTGFLLTVVKLAQEKAWLGYSDFNLEF